MLAPGPIESAAAVKVAVSHSQLTVTLGAAQGSSSGSAGRMAGGQGTGSTAAGLVCQGEVVVGLPAGVFVEGCRLRSSTKLSRAMGLLSVRVSTE